MFRLDTFLAGRRSRRPKSKARKLHDQAMFSLRHGEKVRLAIVGGGLVALASAIAVLTLR